MRRLKNKALTIPIGSAFIFKAFALIIYTNMSSIMEWTKVKISKTSETDWGMIPHGSCVKQQEAFAAQSLFAQV